MNMEINFLGTSGSIPTMKRNHSAILISVGNENILIDCGEGTQRQFRKAKINPGKITILLITHWHTDHVLGIPGLLQTLHMSEYNKTMKIFGPKGTKEKMKTIERLYGNIGIKYEVEEVSGKVLETKDIEISALPMKHNGATNAYSIKIKDRIRLDKNKIKMLKIPNSPVLGKLKHGKDITLNSKKIRAKDISYTEKGKKIAIIMDTLPNQNTVKIAKDSDLLICESSFTSSDKDKAKEYMHLTSEDAAEIAKRSRSKQLVLTHISQRYENDLDKIVKEAKAVFKNVSIAEDLHKIKI